MVHTNQRCMVDAVTATGRHWTNVLQSQRAA